MSSTHPAPDRLFANVIIDAPGLMWQSLTVRPGSAVAVAEQEPDGGQLTVGLTVDGRFYGLVFWKHTVGRPELTAAVEAARAHVQVAVDALAPAPELPVITEVKPAGAFLPPLVRVESIDRRRRQLPSAVLALRERGHTAARYVRADGAELVVQLLTSGRCVVAEPAPAPSPGDGCVRCAAPAALTLHLGTGDDIRVCGPCFERHYQRDEACLAPAPGAPHRGHTHTSWEVVRDDRLVRVEGDPARARDIAAAVAAVQGAGLGIL